MNIRYLAFLFLLLNMTYLLTGCWDRVEVNNLAIITAAALDKKDDKTIELSIQIFVPETSGKEKQNVATMGNENTQSPTLVESAEGVNFADAMLKLQGKISRKIFWGQNEVFIFGEQLAKKGILNELNGILRAVQPRERANLFISKGQAKEILKLNPVIDRNSAESIHKLVHAHTGLEESIIDTLQMMNGESKAVALPWIEILTPQDGRSSNVRMPYIHGTAVLKTDKLLGKLNAEATKGVLMIKNQAASGTITVKPKPEKGYLSAEFVKDKIKLIPQITKNHLSMKLQVQTEAIVTQNSTHLDVMNSHDLAKIEKELAKGITLQIRKALDQGQKKWKADIFGLADTFYRKYPREWKKYKKNWDSLYPNLKIDIQTKFRILRPGMTTENPKI
ncbi:spore germination protein KC [Seinonella peptonophila]|uniref:Spore germination protein KC n=1 Tax=Seinonella peptonophila TaxID=112248 RepID=A0A1M5ADJ5_9BACL|nr:Ger(x)C family spore germination protein [Seinonella peptonophila]SHF28187.1 spore germination protein KC [Seinonella peptonophila]